MKPTVIGSNPNTHVFSFGGLKTNVPKIRSFHSRADHRVFPASGRRYFLIDLTRSPGTRFIFVERSAGLQYRIDDAPGLFHIVLPGKQRSVSHDRVTEHAFVRIHLLCTGVVARQQLPLFAHHLLLLIHHSQTKGSRDGRTDTESKKVARTPAP